MAKNDVKLKHKVQLRKKVEEPEVTPASLDPVGDYQEKRNKKGWMWIALGVVVAFLCILFLWIIPSKDKSGVGGTDIEPAPEQTETTVAGDNGEAVEAPESPENGMSDAAAPTAEPAKEAPVKTEEPKAAAASNGQPAEAAAAAPAPATVKQSASTSHHGKSRRKASSRKTSLRGESKDVLKVIRGDYGNASDRKRNLGSRYRKIQKRVNQLKRSGAF